MPVMRKVGSGATGTGGGREDDGDGGAMIYVDSLRPCVPNQHWKYPVSCHMVADDIRELVIFARRIGLNPKWLQRQTLPHFDLTERMREKAVVYGAVEISSEAMVGIIMLQRKAKP